MRWEQGRVDIERMLSRGEIERVAANREHAERLPVQARRHVHSAEMTCEFDPEGAYGTLDDAARKSLWSILANQGLRPTSRGGHLAVYDVVRAQLDPPMGRTLRPFDRMRRRRNSAEYPVADSPEIMPSDVREDTEKVRAIVDLAERILDEMDAY